MGAHFLPIHPAALSSMTFHLQREQQISVSHVPSFLPLQELNTVLILSLHTSIIFYLKDLYIRITFLKCPAKSLSQSIGPEKKYLLIIKNSLVYSIAEPEKSYKIWSSE